jgi:hypothetical protein
MDWGTVFIEKRVKNMGREGEGGGGKEERVKEWQGEMEKGDGVWRGEKEIVKGKMDKGRWI